MANRIVSIPEIGAIAGTRVALGVGIGLLLADHVKPEKKCAIAADVLSHREPNQQKAQ
jgi:hypothetical protein